jgi:hypothetical protein
VFIDGLFNSATCALNKFVKMSSVGIKWAHVFLRTHNMPEYMVQNSRRDFLLYRVFNLKVDRILICVIYLLNLQHVILHN